MTNRGHTVYHYGHEDSDVVCTEHVTVTTDEDLNKAYGDYNWKKEFFKHDTSDHAHVTFNANAIKGNQKEKQEGGFCTAFLG